jgi:CRP-like cAMP-binding protein
VAVGEAELLEVKKSDFDQIVQKFPRVKEVLHQFYTSRVLDTILAKSDLFRVMSQGVRKELGKRFVFQEYREGQEIVKEGADGDAIYLIRDGEVSVSSKKEGKNLELARLRAGEFFGEVSLLTGKKRTASVIAKGRCDCLRLPRADFEWAMEQCPEVMNIAKSYVEKRVQDTLKTIMKR